MSSTTPSAMAEELRQLGRRQPFQPFRVHINNGRIFEVRDSLEYLVGDVALVLPVHDPHDPDKDYPVCLDVDQVVRIELIEPSSTNGCSP
jgi:hypothetical protein